MQIDPAAPASPAPSSPAASPWWRHSVCYQVYVRSFADGDGDGIGDLPGITERLPYLADLGVDSVWITPFYPSPQRDHGYDVADYRDVDPMFGTLADFDALLERAHALDLRVIVDLVPNHTSSDHVWFQEALGAEPGSPARERYVFRDGLGDDGSLPPNNWDSIFGGPAWTRTTNPDGTPGQWYLHLFDTDQPDLNWWNPEVGEEFESVLRFWLDRGVDGFRVDVAHGLYKPAALTDSQPGEKPPAPMWDQPEVHDVYRHWRRILDSYEGERMAVAEAWTDTAASMARYVRPDELHQTFNFLWLEADWSAAAFRKVVEDSIAAVSPSGAAATWVLSNHDVVRHVTRYGGGDQGLARGRAAVLAMLALPGGVYVYQGEELGLEQVDVPPAHRQDPAFHRGAGEGRDGCRVPMPWSGDTPPFGFGAGVGQPWLPQPPAWKDQTVHAQQEDPHSTLSFYRDALRARRELTSALGDEVRWIPVGEDAMAFIRGDGLLCVLNCGTGPVTVPAEAGELVLASGRVEGDGLLPPDTAAWYRVL